jgi:heavy metal sensor kinase
MKQHLKTLRVRFALWVAGLLLAALAAFGAFVYVRMAHGLAAALDDGLRLSASQAITGITGENLNVEDDLLNLADNFIEGSTSASLQAQGLTIRVLSPDGHMRQAVGAYRSLPVDPASAAAAVRAQPSFATLTDPASGDPVRWYTLPIFEQGRLIGSIQVARSLRPVQATLDQLLAALLISVPLLVLVAAVGGYGLAAHALAPIDRITRTAQRISAGDLHARLNLPPTDDEVGRLAATFDRMLARLDESFQRERQFTIDASHELRTPLAAMQAIHGVIRAQPRTPEEYEQALDDLAVEIDRLRALVEDLLRLARGAAQPTLPQAPVDLSALLRDVADALAPLAMARGLTMACDVPDGLLVAGDSDGLIRLFVNLLDNAIRYTDRGSVTIRATADSAMVRVAIADTGIGIAAQHLPRLFDRFYRVDSARASGGAGLGLAIALEIAQAHRGTIEVHSTVGVGTTFTVRLPLLPASATRTGAGAAL